MGEDGRKRIGAPRRERLWLALATAAAAAVALWIFGVEILPKVRARPASAAAERLETRIAGPGDVAAIGAALDGWDRVVALDPADAHAYFRRAVMLYYLGRYDESIAAADRSAACDPRAAWPLEVKAQGLAALDKYEEAREALGEANDLGDDEARLWWLVAKCEASLGHERETFQALERAAARSPRVLVPLDEPEAAPFRLYRHDPEFERIYKPRPPGPPGPGDARFHGFL